MDIRTVEVTAEFLQIMSICLSSDSVTYGTESDCAERHSRINGLVLMEIDA